jgi:hypothetical protein
MRSAALVLAGYVACGAFMLTPITNFRHLASATYGSDSRLSLWILAWENHAVLDHAPLFDANEFYPTRNSLAYAEHMIGISLFTLPTYALTRNPVLAYNLAWLLSYLSCALAAYALAWRVTHDGVASFLGGVAYAFCFYRMLHGHAHIQLLWACWIPLSLLLLERWWRAPSWPRMAVLWLVVLVQVLTSWYLAVLVIVADALLAAWLLVCARPSREAAGRMATQLATAAAAGAAIVWPIARHYTFLVGAAGDTAAEAVANAASLRDLLTPPLNTWIGQWMTRHGSTAPEWIWGEKTVYLGYVTLALAVAGATRAQWPHRRPIGTAPDRDARLWIGFAGVLTIVALALAAGPLPRAAAGRTFDPTPFGIVSALPGLSLFRVPARFVQLATLGLAVLAAAGAQRIRTHFGRRGAAVVLLLVPLLLAESRLVDFPGGPPQPGRIPAIYHQLATLPARAVVSLPDYLDGPEWFLEADYQYDSTAHWHPIMNGYGRTEPPGYRERMARVATFPSRDSADQLREIGVDYVAFEAARYADGAAARIAAAAASTDFTLVGQSGSDYLFRVEPGRPTDARGRPSS